MDAKRHPVKDVVVLWARLAGALLEPTVIQPARVEEHEASVRELAGELKCRRVALQRLSVIDKHVLAGRL